MVEGCVPGDLDSKRSQQLASPEARVSPIRMDLQAALRTGGSGLRKRGDLTFAPTVGGRSCGLDHDLSYCRLAMASLSETRFTPFHGSRSAAQSPTRYSSQSVHSFLFDASSSRLACDRSETSMRNWTG